ncbi:MAG TPA: hypothetical protein DDX29_12020 [Clostridiales bacterium]|nr:hypothetical protein [Clostridiales bacterium]
MADEYWKKNELYIRHGRGYRQYPFSFGEFVSSDGTVVGSGMVPDGDGIYDYDLLPSEYDCAQDFDPQFDPEFLKNNELATGIMENRFFW